MNKRLYVLFGFFLAMAIVWMPLFQNQQAVWAAIAMIQVVALLIIIDSGFYPLIQEIAFFKSFTITVVFVFLLFLPFRKEETVLMLVNLLGSVWGGVGLGLLARSFLPKLKSKKAMSTKKVVNEEE